MYWECALFKQMSNESSKQTQSMFRKSAYEVWKEERDARCIITLCKDFDDAIGGGIRVGSITEIVGGPGVGKTQFCLQLCVNVQIPRDLHGLGGAAVYIDTNRGFSINRIKEIAAGVERQCDKVYRMENVDKSNTFTVNTMMSNIHCTFCNNYIELLASVYRLKHLLTNTPMIRLIVIDSFSYLFRSLDSDVNLVQMTHEILLKLQQIAEEFKCAVVITNELTTHVTPEETSIIPALGESHLHRVNCQITFGRDLDRPKLFVANINKCFTKCEKEVPFKISTNGLRPF